MFSGMHYVYQVYKEKSFSKAAQKLYISQPSLSASIRKVEEKVGYPLFDRTTKPISLTLCGKKYIQSVEQIQAIEQEFTDYLNDWQEANIGHLTIGGTSLFCSLVFPPLMANFTQKYPNIELTLIEDSTANLEQMVLDGTIDIILANDQLDENFFASKLFSREHLLLAVPKDLPINEELSDYQLISRKNQPLEVEAVAPVDLTLFKELPFILLKQENDSRKRSIELCNYYGFEPKILFEVDQQLTSYMIVSSGLGIAFIGELLISKLPISDAFVYYRLAPEFSQRKINFYWKKGKYLNPVMKKFLEEAQL